MRNSELRKALHKILSQLAFRGLSPTVINIEPLCGSSGRWRDEDLSLLTLPCLPSEAFFS